MIPNVVQITFFFVNVIRVYYKISLSLESCYNNNEGGAQEIRRHRLT